MLEPLRQFMLSKTPSAAQAVRALRTVFLLMFMTQVALALLLGVLLAFVGRGSSDNPVLAQVLVFLALMLLPVTLFISAQMAAAGGKQAALSATLLNAVVLSTPAWFLSLAFAVGTSNVYLFILAAIMLLFYALGLLTVNGFARSALVPEKQVDVSGRGEG